MRAMIAALAWFALTGCADDSLQMGAGGGGDGGSGGAVVSSCPDGEFDAGYGVCLPCAPGSLELPDGSCQPAGVLECGDGFMDDGDVGCEPILPSAACPPGQMAVPGESACRAVAPCGTGTWGDIVSDATTQFVDQSYTGGNNDGSMLAPWTSIQDGIAAAAPGAVVAIAAGSYLEGLSVSKPATLWGRCPELVEVVSTGAPIPALSISAGASGSTVRALAVRGPGVGVVVWGGNDHTLEQLWLHDNGRRGLSIEPSSAGTAIVLRGSLIENNVDHGIVVSGSSAIIEDTVVRANQPGQGLPGRGMTVQGDPSTGAPPHLELTRSVFELNHEGGIGIYGGQSIIDSCVVRDIELDTQGRFGRGLNVQPEYVTDVPAEVTLTRSLVEQTHDSAIFVAASSLTVDSTVVRDSEPDGGNLFGRAIVVQTHPTLGDPGTLVVSQSLLEQSADTHVFSWGSNATLEATVLRNSPGRGVTAQADEATAAESTLTVDGCSITGSAETGIFLSGSSASIDATAIVGSQLVDYVDERAISAQHDGVTPASLSLTRSLVERHRGFAVVLFDATGTVERTLVRDTIPNTLGLAGDAFGVVSQLGLGQLSIHSSTTQASTRAAIFNVGSIVMLSQSHFECQTFDFNGEPGSVSDDQFEDQGGNRCGCPVANGDCRVVSSGLAPPEPLDPLDKSN